MVVDVLALEFFTVIDDEFKTAVIAFDSSFLDEMVKMPLLEMSGPQRGLERTGFCYAEEPSQTCCDTAGNAVVYPLKGLLLAIRAICRIGGPFCAFAMIFYGPVCLGAPVA